MRGRPIKRASMLSKLRSDVNKLKRGVETKTFFETVGANSIPLIGAQFPVGYPYSIVQGLTDSTRIGTKVILKGYNLLLNVLASSPGTMDSFVVLDRQCNGAAAAATDIWQGTGDLMSSNSLNPDNLGRFKILSHKRTVISSTAPYKTVQHKLTRLDIPIQYDNNGTPAVGDLTQNNILVFTQCEASSAIVLNATGSCTLTYTDQ